MVSVSNLDSPIEPLSNEPELENSLHLTQIIQQRQENERLRDFLRSQGIDPSQLS